MLVLVLIHICAFTIIILSLYVVTKTESKNHYFIGFLREKERKEREEKKEKKELKIFTLSLSFFLSSTFLFSLSLKKCIKLMIFTFYFTRNI